MIIPYAIFVFFMAANSQHPPWQALQFEPCSIHKAHTVEPCVRARVLRFGHGRVVG